MPRMPSKLRLATASAAPTQAEEPTVSTPAEEPETALPVIAEPDRPLLGRPPKYQPDFARQAAKLCALGATDEDLAEFFAVNVRTIG
ncbi:MAG: hypothetical protein ACRCVA_12445, partial [Phreatobacter sp.]